MLNLNRLRMLAELARQRTIAATADRLGYSAPAVSQQIALLEREAGIALLERGPRSVTLTDAGRRLAARADEVLASLAAAEDELARLAGLREGLVRLAAFPSAAARVAPRIFEAVVKRAAGVSLHLEDLGPGQSLAALRHEQVDLAIVYDFEGSRLAPGSDLRVEALRQDPFQVCMSARTPLTRSRTTTDRRASVEDRSASVEDRSASVEDRRAITFDVAAGLPWIADGAPPPAQECFALRYLAAHGVTPNVVARTDDPMVLRGLISAGVGVALLPDLQLHPRTGIVAVPLAVAPAPRRILLASRIGSEVNPAVRMVAQLIRRYLREEHLGAE
jgi:DNA-binding transcriptional LysR family regulator